MSQIENYCLKKDSSVEYRICLEDQTKRVDKEFGAAVRKRYFDISEAARESGGVSSGKGDANKWKDAFDAEQSTFIAYRKIKCENVATFEYAGGSNAGGFASKCYLRLTLQRIYDLNVGF